MEFNIVKKGYDAVQVNNFIDELEYKYQKSINELELHISELKNYISTQEKTIGKFTSKTDSINAALIAAVETAKQIEDGSKNIYELEIRRIRLLYEKWESFLNEMIERFPTMKGKFDSSIILNAFSESIENTLKHNLESIERAKLDEPKERVRNLVSKMGNMNQTLQITKPVPPKPNKAFVSRNQKPSDKTWNEFKIENEFKSESKRVQEQNDNIKPIVPNIKVNEGEKYENLVDKYLETDEGKTLGTAYEKNIIPKRKNAQGYPEPNETGFDLKSALSPTEELEDIMKAFDFFTDDDDKEEK